MIEVHMKDKSMFFQIVLNVIYFNNENSVFNVI